MVYRGRPSKACLPCRKRNLLCDRNPHGCSQCRRAELVCTGYRDPKALRIADETASVRAKSLVSQRIKAPTTLDLSIEYRAKNLFYFNYVVGASRPLEFLKPYYSPEPGTDAHLLESLNAVALAHLNFQKRTCAVQNAARQHYIAALRLTNRALRDTVACRRDATLLSVLLLDMYEKLTAQNDEPPRHAGSAHLDGALAIVKLRGDVQGQDPASLPILIRLSTNILIDYVTRGIPIPPKLRDLRDTIASNYPECQDPKWKEGDITMRMLDLQRDISLGRSMDSDIIKRLKQIDTAFQQLAESVDPEWQYQTVNVPHKSQHHFVTYHHIYSTEECARMWNICRHTRVFLHELICARLNADDTGALEKSKHIIQELAHGVCASVPQYISTTLRDIGSGSDISTLSAEDHQSQSSNGAAMPYLPCYKLIFPLFIVGQSVHISADMRVWIIRQLHFMAKQYAIENAARIAAILESGKVADPWHVHCLLGSYAFVC